jgi:hypothetical protein
MQRVNVGKFLAANMFVWGKSLFSIRPTKDCALTPRRNYCSLHCFRPKLRGSHGSPFSSGYLRMHHLSDVPPPHRLMVHFTRAYNAFYYMGNSKCWYAGHCKPHQLRDWVPSSETPRWTCTLARYLNISGLPHPYQLRARIFHSWYTT